MKPQPRKISVKASPIQERTITIFYDNEETKAWIEENCSEFGDWWHDPSFRVFELKVSQLYNLNEVISYIETTGDQNDT
jgi:hypothetical protein